MKASSEVPILIIQNCTYRIQRYTHTNERIRNVSLNIDQGNFKNIGIYTAEGGKSNGMMEQFYQTLQKSLQR